MPSVHVSSMQHEMRGNHIQNFPFGRYIFGHTVGNLVISECISDVIFPKMKMILAAILKICKLGH